MSRLDVYTDGWLFVDITFIEGVDEKGEPLVPTKDAASAPFFVDWTALRAGSEFRYASTREIAPRVAELLRKPRVTDAEAWAEVRVQSGKVMMFHAAKSDAEPTDVDGAGGMAWTRQK
jgi:hypothetical protein